MTHQQTAIVRRNRRILPTGDAIIGTRQAFVTRAGRRQTYIVATFTHGSGGLDDLVSLTSELTGGTAWATCRWLSEDRQDGPGWEPA